MDETSERWHKWSERYIIIWTGRINIVKLAMLQKGVYRFNAIPVKLPMAFLTELQQQQQQNKQTNKKTLYNLMETQSLWLTMQTWERKTELEDWGFLTSVYINNL